MIEIDICIISYAKTEELKLITENGIQSLLDSEQADEIKFNIFVVESNKEINYDYFLNTKTIYTDEVFGYHKYLNLAIKEGSANYILLANSDLIYTKNWAKNIVEQMILHPHILSSSPFCPETNVTALKEFNPYYGYGVRNQINGWAIFIQRNLLSIIGILPEDCVYWFSDNDYSLTLQKYHISHALITNSVVHHHPFNHGATGSVVLKDRILAKEYTDGQYEIFRKKWNL